MKYIENIENKGSKRHVTMHIYQEIGRNGINGQDFANSIQSLDPSKDVLNVRINSVGGSVIEGFGVLSSMMNFKNKGGLLKTYNDGVAASTAGWLFLTADPENRFSKDFALMMLHGVKNDTPNKDFENSIKKIFKNRADVNVEPLMTNGMDNFFDAEKAVEFGFMSENNIESTAFNFQIGDKINLLDVANQAGSFMSGKFINPKPLIMKSVTNALKLQEGVSEELVLKAVNKLRSELETKSNALETAENKIDELTTENSNLKQESATHAENAAKTLVDSYINKGVFAPKNEDEKANLVAKAIESPETFNAMAEMIVIPANGIVGNPAGLGTGEEAPELSEKLNKLVDGRNLRQLEREAPSVLNQIKSENIDVYVNMFNEAYGTKKTAQELS